ncbi:MAG: flagellar FlbD family protein [Bacillota bacterium]
MVRVHRLDGSELVVNADLIETVEATPDTIITLTTGKKIVVRDSVDEVVSGVIGYKQAIALGPPWLPREDGPGSEAGKADA